MLEFCQSRLTGSVIFTNFADRCEMNLVMVFMLNSEIFMHEVQFQNINLINPQFLNSTCLLNNAEFSDSANSCDSWYISKLGKKKIIIQ